MVLMVIGRKRNNVKDDGKGALKNMSEHDAVRMPHVSHPKFKEGFNESDKSLILHLTVTGRCYARCQGCINSAVTLGSDRPRNALVTCQETNPIRDTAIIKQLSDRHSDEDVTVCFYGGEPFLALEKMVENWKRLKSGEEAERFRFLVYTNGEMLESAFRKFPGFMRDIWLYSVSIDGDERQHNRVRTGTDFKNIMRNLEAISSLYRGHMLFWSTLREDQSLRNCFDAFMRCYDAGTVNHFFWHWAEECHPMRDFYGYVSSYMSDLKYVLHIYTEQLGKGRLLPICHLNELVLFLLTARERGHTACGVELLRNYDIVSGKVYPCADFADIDSLGTLDERGQLRLNDFDLNSLVEYKDELGCARCGVHAYCGGRCPVQVISGSIERTRQYCRLMRLHVKVVLEHLPMIAEAMIANDISCQQVYDRSAFLAKYTDVVP